MGVYGTPREYENNHKLLDEENDADLYVSLWKPALF